MPAEPEDPEGVWLPELLVDVDAPLFCPAETATVTVIYEGEPPLDAICDECGVARREHATAREQAEEVERLRTELAEIDVALDSVTMCQAPTRSKRIQDSFEHKALVTDAVVFDAEKAEQSSRAQVVYWMGAARLAAEQRDEATAKLAAFVFRFRPNAIDLVNELPKVARTLLADAEYGRKAQPAVKAAQAMDFNPAGSRVLTYQPDVDRLRAALAALPEREEKSDASET